jgi:hypothetical protein
MGEVRYEVELLVWPDGDTSQKPERWIRTGACRRCGACCESVWRPDYLMGLLEDGAPEDAEGGPDPSPDPPEEGPLGPVVAERWDGRWTFWRAAPPRYGACPMWRGKGICAVYGTRDFPDVCRKWPMFPAEMDRYPTCGFRFERVG